MAVHTYIGARYVPRFMGTYDPTQIYEALDVVDNGSGTSYIARKTVSAGTPLTDTDHWFVYGASSGAIIALQNDMITAQNDILNLQGDMTTAQGNITALQAAVAGLAMTDPYMIFVGDSWADGSQWTFPTWCEALASYFGLDASHHTILDNDSGGFADNGVYGTFADRIRDYPVTGVTVTHIVVAAGVNDRTHTVADIKAGVASFVTEAKTLYPNAQIFVAMPGWMKSSQSDQANILSNSYVGYKDGAIESGVYWLEDPTYSLLFSSDFVDGSHPNQSGSDKVAKSIYNSIMGGSDTTKETSVITKSQGVSVFTPADSDKFTVRKCHDTMNIVTKSGTLDFTCSSQNISAGWKELCILDDPLNFGDYAQTVTTGVFTAGGTPTQVPCMVRIESATGQVYIFPFTSQSAVTALAIHIDMTVPVRM